MFFYKIHGNFTLKRLMGDKRQYLLSKKSTRENEDSNNYYIHHFLFF